eukprot:6333282-Ditylum_brightwellii.AAC.1
MPASKDIKLFFKRALAAMVQELKQLNDGAMEGKPNADVLSDDDEQKALDAVNLIKEKGIKQ